jgi:hypothetical protein
MSSAPSDERSGLSFVIVIIRPLLVNIYRFTCNAHVSDIYMQYVQGLCQSMLSLFGTAEVTSERKLSKGEKQDF